MLFSPGFGVQVSVMLFSVVSRLCFYPTAIKGCRGIVFTHGVRMGGWVCGRREKFVRPVSRKP